MIHQTIANKLYQRLGKKIPYENELQSALKATSVYKSKLKSMTLGEKIYYRANNKPRKIVLQKYDLKLMNRIRNFCKFYDRNLKGLSALDHFMSLVVDRQRQEYYFKKYGLKPFEETSEERLQKKLRRLHV